MLRVIFSICAECCNNSLVRLKASKYLESVDCRDFSATEYIWLCSTSNYSSQLKVSDFEGADCFDTLARCVFVVTASLRLEPASRAHTTIRNTVLGNIQGCTKRFGLNEAGGSPNCVQISQFRQIDELLTWFPNRFAFHCTYYIGVYNFHRERLKYFAGTSLVIARFSDRIASVSASVRNYDAVKCRIGSGNEEGRENSRCVKSFTARNVRDFKRCLTNSPRI